MSADPAPAPEPDRVPTHDEYVAALRAKWPESTQDQIDRVKVLLRAGSKPLDQAS